MRITSLILAHIQELLYPAGVIGWWRWVVVFSRGSGWVYVSLSWRWVVVFSRGDGWVYVSLSWELGNSVSRKSIPCWCSNSIRQGIAYYKCTMSCKIHK